MNRCVPTVMGRVIATFGGGGDLSASRFRAEYDVLFVCSAGCRCANPVLTAARRQKRTFNASWTCLGSNVLLICPKLWLEILPLGT